MNLEQPCIRISVRNLVEFILRHGDIDNRTGGADKDAMQQGSRIHRKIQRQQGAEYRAEVPLRDPMRWIYPECRRKSGRNHRTSEACGGRRDQRCI